MINQLSNAINRNQSAAKISKVMSSSKYTPEEGQKTRLPESTCDIVENRFKNISLKCEGRVA